MRFWILFSPKTNWLPIGVSNYSCKYFNNVCNFTTKSKSNPTLNYHKLILCFWLLIAVLSSAEAQQHEINLIGGFSSNTVLRFVSLDGGGSYSGNGAWHTGIGFNKKIRENLWLTSGLVYNQHRIKITPEYFPDVEIVTRTETIHILSIPLEFRLGFMKYFFINGGPNLDFGINNNPDCLDSQSGFGWRIGIGAKIEYKKVIFVLNPYLKAHSLPAFNPERYQQHLMESGVSFGVGYSF